MVASAPKTQPYRNQHAELARLAAAVPCDARTLSPEAARRALQGLKSVLIVHLTLQDGMLYPWIFHHSNACLKERATEHRARMRGFLMLFLEFYQRWETDGAIADNRQAFVTQWSCIASLMRRRLANEISDLYRFIESEEARLDCSKLIVA